MADEALNETDVRHTTPPLELSSSREERGRWTARILARGPDGARTTSRDWVRRGRWRLSSAYRELVLTPIPTFPRYRGGKERGGA